MPVPLGWARDRQGGDSLSAPRKWQRRTSPRSPLGRWSREHAVRALPGRQRWRRLPVPGLEGGTNAGPSKTRLEANGLLGEVELGPGPEPVDELSQGLEAAHPEDLLELGQGVEVLASGVVRGQGSAGRQLVDSEPGLQVVEQEAHLGPLSRPRQHRRAAGRRRGPAGCVRVVEPGRCPRGHSVSASRRSPRRWRPRPAHPSPGQAARPVDQLRQRPRRGLRPEQTGCWTRRALVRGPR